MKPSNFWWRRRLLYLQPEIKQTLLLDGASLQAAAPPSCAASAPGASSPAQKLNAGQSLAEATIGEPAPKATTVEESGEGMVPYTDATTEDEKNEKFADQVTNFPQPVPVAAPVPQMAAANPFDTFSSAVMVEEPMPPTVDMRSEETKRLAKISEEWFKTDDAPF